MPGVDRSYFGFAAPATVQIASIVPRVNGEAARTKIVQQWVFKISPDTCVGLLGNQIWCGTPGQWTSRMGIICFQRANVSVRACEAIHNKIPLRDLETIRMKMRLEPAAAPPQFKRSVFMNPQTAATHQAIVRQLSNKDNKPHICDIQACGISLLAQDTSMDDAVPSRSLFKLIR